jgi:hypothetical protein
LRHNDPSGTVTVVTLIAWTIVLAGAVAAVAAVQCLWLDVLRRGRVQLRLPDPVAYTDRPSFCCASEIVLRIHSSKPVRVRFNRCDAVKFVAVHTIEAAAASQPRRMDRWRGCNWTATAVLPGDTLTPGFYRLDVEHQDDAARRWYLSLLVRPAAPRPLVVVAPTNTWNAYNDFGGLSNYRDRATPIPLRPIRALMRWFNVRWRLADRHWLFAVPLPERRPNIYIHHALLGQPGTSAADIGPAIRAEAALIRYLEREDLSYMVISDRDFAYEIDASTTRTIIVNSHSEYWSEEMIGRLGEMIDRGCSIIFLSGNNIYRKVQLMEDAISVIDMMIPQHQVVPLIGTYSDAYGWRTHAAYRVTDPDHWCFQGLDVAAGTEFGCATADRPGASGDETDKIRPGSFGFRVVAVGKNRDGPAFMVCRDTPGGSFVFNVSSMSFTPCLDDDPFIQELVRNLLRRGLAGPGRMRVPAAATGG